MLDLASLGFFPRNWKNPVLPMQGLPRAIRGAISRRISTDRFRLGVGKNKRNRNVTMDWTRIHSYCWQRDDGYRVAAFRVGGGLRYGAFAPAINYEVFKDRMKVRYALGQSVPQQREPLGSFDDAESAREACARHEQSKKISA
jgi:hypothetical protein